MSVDSPARLMKQAEQCLASQENLQAISLVEAALAGAADDFNILDSAAKIYSLCNKHHEARDTLLLALTIQPDNPLILYNLATRLRFIGDLTAAKDILDRVIDLTPENAEATYLRSTLLKQTAQTNHIEFIKARLGHSNQSALVKSCLHYALAKEYEDMEQWEDSFKELSIGASIRRSTMQYNSAKYNASLARTRTLFTKEFIQKENDSYNSEAPIFILGLPRTGSTLLDTIISGHKNITSGGELMDFPRVMIQAITHELSKTPNVPRDKMTAALDIDFSKLGEHYIESVSKKFKPGKYFTDKLPLNFQYCGLIHKALPNAKILHIYRNPMDTCYSMYKALFLNAYPHSYNLEEIADYFITYFQLMEHWHKVMPGKILDVKYEDVVANIDHEARKIIKWCGLKWDPNCLKFNESKAAITTLSAPQVRQKLYTSSIGKWQFFEEQLKPICRKLDDAGISYK